MVMPVLVTSALAGLVLVRLDLVAEVVDLELGIVGKMLLAVRSLVRLK